MNTITRFLGFQYRQVVIVASGLLIGIISYSLGQEVSASILLSILCIWGTLPLINGMIQSLRQGEFGIDILAITAITAALLMQEFLTAAVILLMLTGGEALEAYAQERAKKELSDLMSRAPKIAHKHSDKKYIDIPVAEVQIGDTILIKPGETIPVDAVVVNGTSQVDESALTGESLPIDKTAGSELLSGSINQSAPLTAKTIRTSGNSQYEQIIQLVRSAASTRSPLVRLADRYSVPFTIVSLTIAGLAWGYTGQAIKALEVLVVATPCPLLLATPVAIVSGMSRAAKRGIIIKHGAALERLAVLAAIAFDKTGTLTTGVPSIEALHPVKGSTEHELLQLAASLEHHSAHALANAVTHRAFEQGIELLAIHDITEQTGAGLTGHYGDHRLFVGKLSYLEEQGIAIPARLVEHSTGKTAIYLGRDTAFLGVITFVDALRPETKATLTALHQLGIKQTAMLTGDKAEVAHRIASQVGIEQVEAECLPADKLAALTRLRTHHHPLAMVGDGINDAPTLAAADVGIALGAKGQTAASESADVVIMLDDLSRVAESVHISQRSVRIAYQSIFVGIGLSLVLMIIAATVGIQPLYGAILQEAVDILVIFNALRARFG